MTEKNRPNPTGTDPVPDDDAGLTGPVYDIDSDNPEPIDPVADGGVEPAEDTADDGAPGRRISREDVLERFQEKNEVIARLTREKMAAEKQKADLEAQAREFKDKWMRAAAEFENYRRRSAREWELLKQQSKSEVILEVLNSLDDFERAFAVVDGTGDNEFVQGIRLIYNNLLVGLQKLGVVELDATHQPFDPNVHMAIGQIETTETESGHVVQVVQKGYSLDGMLIRPARVIVAK
ncbi:MAG TPA: nucleotide exchange factor GrpE [Candidatus Krumholzibacteria bacterium]|nr:nucleotide exchange factor GrpE [Candidatus Krumholzibacteria bacterium]